MFHPGDSIGLYTLVRPLGRGAFGEVECPLGVAERRSSILAAQVALKLPVEAQADAENTLPLNTVMLTSAVAPKPITRKSGTGNIMHYCL